MKFKWNWLDTLIVCVVVVLIASATVFFVLNRPSSLGEAVKDSNILIGFDSYRDEPGTYDDIKVGDKVMFSSNGQVLGEIVDVEILPSRTAVFNENTKKYQIDENENFVYCRFTVKASGYINDRNEAFAGNKAVLYSDEWYLETTSQRLAVTVTGIKEANDNA